MDAKTQGRIEKLLAGVELSVRQHESEAHGGNPCNARVWAVANLADRLGLTAEDLAEAMGLIGGQARVDGPAVRSFTSDIQVIMFHALCVHRGGASVGLTKDAHAECKAIWDRVKGNRPDGAYMSPQDAAYVLRGVLKRALELCGE